jgi:hypothetical protein
MVDEEIRNVRQARREISAEFDHDVDRVIAYYRSVEEELKQSGKFRFARTAVPGTSSPRPETITTDASDRVGRAVEPGAASAVPR